MAAPPTARIAPDSRSTSLPTLIHREKARRLRRWLTWSVTLVLLAALGVALWLTLRPRPLPLEARFRMQPASHGDVVREVRATGHVEAVSTVSVGAEISGRIATVEVDYNDRVKTGQVLARFDRAALEAQRAQTAALAAAARAQLAQARSDVEQARRTRARADDLFKGKAMSESEHEGAVTAAALAEARLSAAEASLAAQEAAATISRTNLDHAVIRAPIDGVIITRNIDPGQTVASMLQTPVLFTVAADLRKMEVEAAVDEADIGLIALGQTAVFTVNAWPDRVYEGVVTEVRNSARVVQEVVTYGTVVAVDNLDLSLKPGMTASVRVRTGVVKDVDRVPNAALHFVPPGEVKGATPSVWTMEGSSMVRHEIAPGLSDGELTAISAGQVPANARLLVDLTPEGKKVYGLTPAR